MHAPSLRRAFTLIELLVVVAVIALLISLLVPAIAGARGVALDLVGLNNIRTTSQANSLYADANAEWLPGPNTSGLELHRTGLESSYGGDAFSATQDWDWLSPLQGSVLPAPRDRLEKFEYILDNEQITCPRNDTRYSLLFQGPTLPSYPDGDTAGAPNPRLMSFTVSPHFLTEAFVTNSFAEIDELTEDFEAQVTVRASSFEFVTGNTTGIQLPETYTPKIDRIGSPSLKSFTFEGGRFFFGSIQGFDYTTLVDTTGFAGSPQGNFSSLGPIFLSNLPSGMGGYRRNADGTPSDVFRNTFLHHTGDKMLMSFFDGSARSVDHLEAANPTLYSPSGSIVKTPGLLFAEEFPFDSRLP